MSRFAKLLLIAIAGLTCSSVAWAGKTQNVILVIVDGVRWQEVFTGVDPTLVTDGEYWHDDPRVRRRLLFPFLWDTIATQGRLFGNQQTGSIARVANPLWFVTVFEWLNGKPESAGRVEIFGTWAVFADIFNDARSGLPIRAGGTVIDASDRSPRGELLHELYRTTTRFEGTDPFDSFLHVAVREHLRTHKPRVMFIGYGDTDTWQHMGRYDNFLETAHSFDAYMSEFWQQIQSSPDFKDRRGTPGE